VIGDLVARRAEAEFGPIRCHEILVEVEKDVVVGQNNRIDQLPAEAVPELSKIKRSGAPIVCGILPSSHEIAGNLRRLCASDELLEPFGPLAIPVRLQLAPAFDRLEKPRRVGPDNSTGGQPETKGGGLNYFIAHPFAAASDTSATELKTFASKPQPNLARYVHVWVGIPPFPPLAT
jgi:hypothetical protein